MKSAISNLQFLKLGGSLITDKTTTSTPRLDVLARVAGEIAVGLAQNPDMKLVLGHGSGSFGHVAAKKFGTRQGVRTHEEWQGFAEVWYQASALNRLVVDALHKAGLPAVSFPASAAATTENGKVVIWNLEPLRAALEAHLLPVVFGDVAFDTAIGGTILSTEDVFQHLAPHLNPERILLAGIESGVWADYPDCTQLIEEITPASAAQISNSVSGSAATDVTGGMASKVEEMLALVQQINGLEVSIFSGKEPDAVRNALLGDRIGTHIGAGEANA